jgi:zinc transporter ZupT
MLVAWEEKLVAIAVVIAAALIGLVLGMCTHHGDVPGAPACVNRCAQGGCGTASARRSVATGMYLFCGGVLVAAALVHLLAESSETLSEAIPQFPLAPFLCGCGFIVTLAIETIGHSLHHAVATAHPGGELRGILAADDHRLSGEEESSADEASLERRQKASTPATPERVSAPSLGLSSFRSDGESVGTLATGAATPARSVTPYTPPDVQASWPVAMLLFLCLSFHSLVEGIALGVAQDGLAVTDVLLAIIAHKWLASTALVTSLLRAHTQWCSLLGLIGAFSLVTPTGVVIGLIADAAVGDSDSTPAMAGVTAFAAGTFLYVGVVEMIVREIERHHHHSHHHDAAASGVVGSSTHLLRPRSSQGGTSVGAAATSVGIALVGYSAMSVIALWV